MVQIESISNAKIHLEFFGTVSIYFGIGVQIIFALILGGLVGYDREVKMKAAGFKTNIMICIGATLYTTISMINLGTFESTSIIDPNRVSAQIVSGIGFLGAGAIIQGRGSVTGLTTAATIWVVAAIGYTIGAGFPIVATLFSVTVLIVLRLLHPVNKMIEKEKDFKNFHLEILSYGNCQRTIHSIFQFEGLESYHLSSEDFKGDKNLNIYNIYLNCHTRSIERISSDIKDSVQIKKVVYREIIDFPEDESNISKVNYLKSSNS